MAVTYSAAFARGFLRKLYRGAQASGVTLIAAIQSASDEAQLQMDGGKALVKTAANGRTAEFAFEGTGLTPRDIAELSSRLEDKYYTAKAALTGTPTDEQILDKMLESIVPITRFRSQFYSLTR